MKYASFILVAAALTTYFGQRDNSPAALSQITNPNSQTTVSSQDAPAESPAREANAEQGTETTSAANSATEQAQRSTFACPGLVVPARQFPLRVAVAGVVAADCPEEGDQVTAGQMLIKVDDRQAAAELQAQRARARAVEQSIHAAEIRLETAQHELKRQQAANARRHGVVSAQTMFKTRQEGRAALVEIRRLKEQHQAIVQEIASATIALEQYQVVAPTTGEIRELLVSPGQYVQAGEQVGMVDSAAHLIKIQLQDATYRKVAKSGRLTGTVAGTSCELNVARLADYNPDGSRDIYVHVPCEVELNTYEIVEVELAQQD